MYFDLCLTRVKQMKRSTDFSISKSLRWRVEAVNMQRRRVQAQRKFAQGAHIPTSASTSTAKQNLKTQKDENLNVFISTAATSATHLLDILSLKDSHEHRQPVVLLERLPSTSTTKSTQKKTDAREQEKIPEKREGMCLRPSNRCKNRLVTYKRTTRNYKKKLKTVTTLSNIEDETPLLYLRKQNIKNKPKKGPGQIERNQISSLKETKRSSTNATKIAGAVTITEDVTKKTCTQNNQALPNNVNVRIPDEILVHQFDSDDTKSESNAMSLFNVCTVENKNPPPRTVTPQPSTSFADHEIQNNIMRINSTGTNETDSNIIDYAFDIDSPDNIIIKMEFSNNITVSVEDNTEEITPCISRNLSTVNKIISAPISDFTKQCNSCIYCTSVKKVRRILEFFRVLVSNYPNSLDYRTESSNENGDLYIFIPPTKDAAVTPALTYYINLTAEIDSLIELKLFWADCNQLQIISADMIPKTPNITTTNLDVFHNHYLFNELLDFITNSEIRYHKMVTVQLNPKLESIEISGDESDTDYNEHVIKQNFLTSNPSTRIHEVNEVRFPFPHEPAQKLEAPQFYPTDEEFRDPIKYFINIMPVAAKFGICKVVAPQGFKPQCVFDDSVRFAVTNQYISRLFKRWGPGLKELCAIKAYLASQSVIFNRPPLLDGIELNLPKLYCLVQSYGGLREVIQKKRWPKIAEEMRLTKTQKIGHKLDKIYVKYILPYDTLSEDERRELMSTVEIHWEKKYQRMLRRALKPLHRQRRILSESETSEEEVEDDIYVTGALNEAEDCITKGRLMKLSTYKKVANKAAETFLQNSDTKSPDEIEEGYWKIVTEAKEHVCVNSASIDTGEEGYGFTKNQNDYYGTHSWNLKVLSQNENNVLKSLGSVLGVTIPTLHLGMAFSTSCWHRDPHGLPWIEYMHSGPGKIWYGIPNEQSDNFRSAVETLCPTSCQKKSIWLPSDIVMIPPNLLLEHNVSISRAVQKPGEFIIVFPKAYSCSVSTGYTVSESVYFAPYNWLDTVEKIFTELRESCEPTMFSIDQLLLSVARDPHAPVEVLSKIFLSLERIIRRELANRLTLARYKVQDKTQPKRAMNSRKRPSGAWNVREQEECGICQTTLYLSRVWGLTEKKQSVCLQHALELLNKDLRRTRDTTNVGLEVFLTETELERLITNIHNRIQGHGYLNE